MFQCKIVPWVTMTWNLFYHIKARSVKDIFLSVFARLFRSYKIWYQVLNMFKLKNNLINRKVDIAVLTIAYSNSSGLIWRILHHIRQLRDLYIQQILLEKWSLAKGLFSYPHTVISRARCKVVDILHSFLEELSLT